MDESGGASRISKQLNVPGTASTETYIFHQIEKESVQGSPSHTKKRETEREREKKKPSSSIDYIPAPWILIRERMSYCARRASGHSISQSKWEE
jgi:hypothetical protein